MPTRITRKNNSRPDDQANGRSTKPDTTTSIDAELRAKMLAIGRRIIKEDHNLLKRLAEYDPEKHNT